MEGPHVVPEKGGVDWHIFAHRHHHSFRHCPCHGHYLFTRQPDTLWAYMWSSIEQCIGKNPSPLLKRDFVKFGATGLSSLSAIVVACLASFRSLFTQQGSRIREPKHTIQDASRNLFLHGTKRIRPPNTSIGLTELSGRTEQYTQPSKPHNDGNSDLTFDYTNLGSTEHIVPPNAVRIKQEV